MMRAYTAALGAVLLAAGAARAQGAAAFQQGVDYRIEARLDEATSVLHGRARLRYTNHSPNALDTLYLHQHLNAFRPNSAWAQRDLQQGVRQFQDLGPADYAYERFTAVAVDGRPARPVYPVAPDSTVVAIPLPARLAPGATTTLLMDWDARLSTVPRRQGRAGRHYDFAQWYPRIAVYEQRGWAAHPLLRQGEFYGEFATYDVTLDLAADQVVGATGVAVEGDPGWTVSEAERAAFPARAAEPLGLLTGGAAAGRKRVRFHAENVHHFAWAIDPAFRHESVTRASLGENGSSTPLPTIHVLFLPADTGWAEYRAARRTHAALTWLGGMLGPYPYPQFTNLHRLESGGTEFPMLIMNGSASESLIVHETTHQWLHGMLANNEWREGWMDEGFTSFLTSWYQEERLDSALAALPQPQRGDSIARAVWGGGMTTLEHLARTDSLAPLSLAAEAYPSPRIYNAMTYTRGSATFRMLREVIGEEAFRRALRTFYQRYRFHHVTGEDFRRVAEEAGGRSLDAFWQQWVRGNGWADYAVSNVRVTRERDGRWRTRGTVTRTGPAWMPVEVRIGQSSIRLLGAERRQGLDVITPARPDRVVVDPRAIVIDPDRSNNAAPVP